MMSGIASKNKLTPERVGIGFQGGRELSVALVEEFKDSQSADGFLL